MEPETTSDAEAGVPSWGRWRILYAMWNNAADWQTRGSAVRAAIISWRDRHRAGG